jgi:hypothetical protein
MMGTRMSRASLVLLIVQLALVSSIAAKYLYQRRSCPRVWTRAAAYDPELAMRGRYLSLQLTADGCGSTLPSHAMAEFPRNVDGTVASPRFAVRGGQQVTFQAKLAVDGNKLVALRLPEVESPRDGEIVSAWPGTACDQMRVVQPVNFYVAEHAQSPLPLKQGDELWIEVTVPPKGPPRPLQLALKQQGAWRPLAFQ